MFKKEVVRDRRWNARGQITLFIIVGLVILFSFLMVIQLTNSVAKGKLQQEQEKVELGGFRKEALRLYVQDCLEKSLEKGLVLLGKQGTIWSDQPGGSKAYVEGVTGVELPVTHDQVVYGITKKQYSNPDWYPCNGDDSATCTYTSPNTSVRFGVLTVSDVAEDLRLYLKDQTYVCVNQFVEQNISRSAVVEKQDLDLQLDMQNDGISVRANYPLKFSLSGQDFFYLSRFDFFYPTKFKQFYRSAVEFPFQQDYNFVDYELTANNLLLPEFTYGSEKTRDVEIAGLPATHFCDVNPILANTFLCKRTTFASTYTALNTQLAISHSANGADDIFEYTVPSGIVKNQPYTFKIARQNRPPALDYVHRLECPTEGYDYLVIKGDTSSAQLGKIDIQLNAKDPDEDEALTYSFSESTPALLSPNPSTDKLLNVPVVTANSGIYRLTATATDSHGAIDKQDVRVLVDPELTTSISFDLPYGTPGFNFKDGAYFVSVEDPVFLKLSFPEPRYNGKVGTARLSVAGADWNSIILPTSPGLTSVVSYPLPSNSENPSSNDINFYSNPPNTIENIRTTFSVNPFNEPNKHLDLTLDYEVNYCGDPNLKQTSPSTATVIVKECVPHRNLGHDSYPYNDINAFLADHTCCSGEPNNPQSWRVNSDTTKICHTDSTPGCYGLLSGYVGAPGNVNNKNPAGYVLETRVAKCNGNRGNICGPLEGVLPNGGLRCGIQNNPSSCTNVITECNNQLSWGLVDNNADHVNEGWCYGTMGCEQFCSKSAGQVVVLVGDALGTPYDQKANEFAKSQHRIIMSDKIDCGCKLPTRTDRTSYVGKPCDANFDGTFKGTCKADGSCT